MRKAHKPEAETHIIDITFRIKSWIEPCLNSIKHHVYPHTHKFTKVNGEVVMKYKQWASDESWLPEGPGLRLLAQEPERTPAVVRQDTTKMLDVKALEDNVKKCKRLTAEQREWWDNFIHNERRYRQKWSSASEEYLKNAKKKTNGI